MLDKLPLTKQTVLLLAGVVFLLLVGGYILYFHAEHRLAQKDREYEILTKQSQENYNELKNKYDENSAELKKLHQDTQDLLKNHQECKEKQEELQAKYDALSVSNEKTKALLREAELKLGIPPTTSDHPIKQLNNHAQESKKEEVLIATNQYHCPSSQELSTNAPHGSWKDSNHLTWQVVFTSRPLVENELINELFKVLYDGESLDCYYALGKSKEETWIVVKSQQSKDKPFKLSEKGWVPCSKGECKSKCENENLKECTFSLP